MMIRINLVTEKKKKKKKKAQGPSNIKITLVAVNVAALLAAGGPAYYLEGRVSVLKSETDSNKKSLEALNKKSEDLKKQEEIKKELQRRGALIEKLTKDQAVPVKTLDGVSNAMPEGVWLAAFNFNNNSINLDGYAFSNNDIVSCVDNLKKNFDEVYLEEAAQAVVEKTPVYRFKMRFNVRK
jgi:Tfp pilus assembly protein PilN